jgi:5-methylcytosine-specific restriction endonuclease McrBC regulatory subunit McrC
MLTLFTSVNSGAATKLNVSREAIGLIRGLPRRYHFYEPALWLAYLIATKSGVLMESVGRARFDSLIVDMALVFENYVRKLCEEAVSRQFIGCQVFDGNKRAVPLFCTGAMFTTQPDYYFCRSGKCVAVADAKYKPKLSTQDRYEVLAFCESLGVSKAAFVCPQVGNSPVVAHHGTTRGGRELYVLSIDLGARDMLAEERRFQVQLGKTLGL